MKRKTTIFYCHMLLKRKISTLILLCFILNLNAQLHRDSVQLILDVQELHQPTTIDLDGDGDEDILGSLLGLDGHLATLENTDGEGTLDWPKVFGDSAWADFPKGSYDFIVADMDNDGDPDIVDLRRAISSYPFWENDGQGNFSLIMPADNPLGNGTVTLRVADFNNDGWLDILYYNYSSRMLNINWNQGAGQPFLYDDILFLGYPPFYSYNDLELCDYDQDGDLDIIIISSFQDDPFENTPKYLRLEVVTQEDGGFTLENGLDFAHTDGLIHYRIATSAIELDGDTYPDLIITVEPRSFPMDYGMLLLRNDDGSGTFTHESTIPDYVFHTVVDIDGDEDEDLIVAKQAGSDNNPVRTYEWLENTGSLNFTPHPIDSIFTGFHLFTGDLNQDGLLDFITSDTPEHYTYNGGDKSQLFCRFGMDDSGNFAPPVPLTGALGYIRGFEVQDWNGDAEPDILLAVEDGIRWIEKQSGGSNFNIPVQTLAGSR